MTDIESDDLCYLVDLLETYNNGSLSPDINQENTIKDPFGLYAQNVTIIYRGILDNNNKTVGIMGLIMEL